MGVISSSTLCNGLPPADLSGHISQTLAENADLTKELDVLQLYLQNMVRREEKDLGPGLLSSHAPSQFTVEKS